MDLLLALDKQIFLFLNNLPHSFFWDSLFSFFSSLGSWGIAWFLIMAGLFIWEEIKDRRGLLALILAIILSVTTGDLLIKNMIRRPRPEFTLNRVIVGADERKSFSFPSGHSTIAFAAAYILSREHSKWKFGYYLVALIIAFSRIYLGKHYPLDIIGGAGLGTVMGIMALKIISFITPSPNRGRRK